MRFTAFYRATLCVSTVLAIGRCLSVCPPVMLLYCIQIAKDIVNLLSQSSSPIILVSRSRLALANSTGIHISEWRR